MSDATPTFEQVLQGARNGAVGGLYVELPAIVDAYDEDRQCVDAVPVILVTEELEDGSTKTVQLPTVLRAPVTFYGGGGCRITIPIAVGDVVMLRFTSANLSRWLEVGGQSETQDGRRHNLCSAVAYPGGHSFGGSTAPKTTAPTDAMVLHAPKLRLGGPDAAQALIKGTAYRAAEDTLLGAETTFLGALGTYAAALGGLPGMAGAAGVFATALGAFQTARSTYSSAVAGTASLSTVVFTE
ncbi:MAG: Gp138 family membrane-puncturing spike protein [Alsobacter sp.]